MNIGRPNTVSNCSRGENALLKLIVGLIGLVLGVWLFVLFVPLALSKVVRLHADRIDSPPQAWLRSVCDTSQRDTKLSAHIGDILAQASVDASERPAQIALGDLYNALTNLIQWTPMLTTVSRETNGSLSITFYVSSRPVRGLCLFKDTSGLMSVGVQKVYIATNAFFFADKE